MDLLRTKPVAQLPPEAWHPTELKRCLSAFDLTFLGIGAIIGAGIFVITGIAAATEAGPAITISYIIAGLACAFSALSYAELASSIGGCGSAYGYAYASLGELIAWVIGWDLMLEYGVAVSAVAIGWAGYVNNALNAIGLTIPAYLLHGPWDGGVVNVLAVVIILLISGLLALGVHHSSRVNTIMVFIKLAAITLFVVVACFYIEPANWRVFMPFGWQGVMEGAALIFFAYIGFDAVSTAAEEAIEPQRDMPIGIILSLIICTIIYVIVASLLTLVAPYQQLNVPSPVAQVLLNLGQRAAAGVISMGAVAGLTTVILVMFYGLTRVFFAMSRDGLLPPIFSRLNATTRAPVRVILLSGFLIAVISGFIPMKDIAQLVNIGTLVAFIIVCAGVMVLRYTRPDMPRPFRVPFCPLTPLLGIFFCSYLALSLPWVTWVRFAIWMALGFAVYFLYSRFHSKVR